MTIGWLGQKKMQRNSQIEKKVNVDAADEK